ncbi:MAG TPA: lipoprotein [Steroidobacteraceae bacterium]|jgi:predicted small lipoprotein YifL
MPARTKFTLLALLALTTAACGLKGPLYQPDEPRNESVTPGQSTQTPRKKDNSGSTQPGEQTEPPIAPPDPDRPVVPPSR